MHRILAAMGCWLFLTSCSRGDPGDALHIPGSLPIPRPSHNVKDWGPLDYDDTPGAEPGGIVFGRQGGQWFVRFGGGLLPMRIRTSEPGPNGPITTRMVLPSAAQSSLVPLTLQHQAVPIVAPGPALPVKPAPDRACVQVQIPDAIGLLYVDGRLTETRGTSRLIESPALEPGKAHTFKLRAGFKVGENLLIEDREVVVRAGQVTDATFDGTRATSVALPKSRR
jgi:uncharacterized protein (TIGR03000 family)